MGEITIDIRAQSDVVAARRSGRELASRLGFGLTDQTRLATAISELTRNVIQYAETGVCRIIDTSDPQTARIRVVVEDHGPGIADIEQAMAQGFSTSAGLGAGLPGVRRLMHEFDIESEPGHTRIAIAMSRRRT